MPDIQKINAVAIADIEKLDSILAADIEKVNGLVFTGEVHVFLLAGQSNMVGRPTFDGGTGYPSGTLQYPKATGYPTYTDTTTIAASPPLGHWDAQAGDMGLALQFSIDYASATGATVVLIPAADGGTGFSGNHWNPGDAQYEHAVDATNALMTANSDWIFKAILWHQGESDSGNNSFAQQFHKMIQQMREDITVADQNTPFILGELVVGGSQTTPLNSGVLTNTPTYNYRTALVSSASLTSYDNLHFDAASLRTFGTRYRTDFSGLSNPYPTAETGATGHWLFGTGNQLYIDLTGSATNLTENGTAPTFEYNLLEISGQGDGLASAITEPSNLTMCLVIEYETSEQAILNGTLGPQAIPDGVSMFFNQGELRMNERGGFGNLSIAASSAFTAGNYYFIAMSVDSSDNYVGYLGDNTSTTVISGTGPARNASTRALSVGDVHYNQISFTGTPKIAAAIFFDTAKTESELDAIYSRSVTRMSARNITVQ
jgi:hypothetical protein